MKTAIEWLFEELYNKDIINDYVIRAFEQAQGIEELQIINAYDEGKVEGMCLANNSEYKHLQGFEYYDETYKNTKQ